MIIISRRKFFIWATGLVVTTANLVCIFLGYDGASYGITFGYLASVIGDILGDS